ncbi:MAG: GxxExxY protein [Chitinophagaceae bacterium]|nr:MAG: GxxExxY protein [Chitinophagaceae bacterium]
MNYLKDLLYREECFKIVGLCMKVHNSLGKGFIEVVYKDALEIEFQKNGIPYEREKALTIKYEGETLQRTFRADFVLYNCIILEIKAVPFRSVAALRQTLHYLKASGIQLGILINFGQDRLESQRIVCSY